MKLNLPTKAFLTVIFGVLLPYVCNPQLAEYSWHNQVYFQIFNCCPVILLFLIAFSSNVIFYTASGFTFLYLAIAYHNFQDFGEGQAGLQIIYIPIYATAVLLSACLLGASIYLILNRVKKVKD